jgi:hypothetical protein
MPAIRRISAPTLARRGGLDDRAYVRFALNNQPDEAWIRLFKAHAASSVLGAANAVFNGTRVSLDVTKVGGVAELTTALDCFIECANLRLRSFPSRVPDPRATASLERARLYSQRV